MGGREDSMVPPKSTTPHIEATAQRELDYHIVDCHIDFFHGNGCSSLQISYEFSSDPRCACGSLDGAGHPDVRTRKSCSVAIRRGTTELTLRHLGNKQDPQLRVEFPIEPLARAGAYGNSCPGLRGY